VRFAVVPDATTAALELRKGTGDLSINFLTPDTVHTLEREPFLAVEHAPGTEIQYLGFNLRDPILKDVRVRQAIAYAIDRRPMIQYLWGGWAARRAAYSLRKAGPTTETFPLTITIPKKPEPCSTRLATQHPTACASTSP